MSRFDSAIATQFKRTQQTIDPICESRAIGRVTASASDSKAIAEHILENCNGMNVFVAGHSNTVPAIMRALGVRNPPRLTEDDYNDVFIITMAPDRQATMLHLKIEMDEEAEPAP